MFDGIFEIWTKILHLGAWYMAQPIINTITSETSCAFGKSFSQQTDTRK